MHQSRRRAEPATTNVAQRIAAASKAASDVSQTHSNGINIAFGKMAQSQPAALATPRPQMRFPAKKIGTQAADEKRIFSVTAAKNAWAVKAPQSLNMPARIRG